MGTIDPAASASLASGVAAAGGHARRPRLREPRDAEASRSIMVGGNEEAYERVRRLLLQIGPK